LINLKKLQPQRNSLHQVKNWFARQFEFATAGFSIRYGEIRRENNAHLKLNEAFRDVESDKLVATKDQSILDRREIIKYKRWEKKSNKLFIIKKKYDPSAKKEYKSTLEKFGAQRIKELFGNEGNIKTGIISSRRQRLFSGIVRKYNIYRENRLFRSEIKSKTRESNSDNRNSKVGRIKDRRNNIRSVSTTVKLDHRILSMSKVTNPTRCSRSSFKFEGY